MNLAEDQVQAQAFVVVIQGEEVPGGVILHPGHARQGHQTGAHRVGTAHSDKTSPLYHPFDPESQNGHGALLDNPRGRTPGQGEGWGFQGMLPQFGGFRGFPPVRLPS